MKDKIPIWLKYVSQNIPTKKPRITIIELALLIDKEDGIKLINVYWDGIKLVIKLVDDEAIIINTKTKFVTSKLSNLPIISVGLVSILDKFSGSCFKNASTPETMNKAKNEKIIKFKTIHKLPFFNWFSLFTYLEKSPKLKIAIEKYAKVVPVTVINGLKLFILKKLSKFKTFKKACDVNLTSLKSTEKKNINIAK